MLPQTGVDGERVVIADFNSKLATRAASFASSNSGVRPAPTASASLAMTHLIFSLQAKTYIVDTNALIVKLLNSPTTYGFKDATSYGSGTDQMWCTSRMLSDPESEKI